MNLKPFKLFISPYKLSFKHHKKQIEGALLAFEFKGGRTGCSDFLPWPDFGEENLFQQLKQIQKKIYSPRFIIAYKNASLDAQARTEKRNLFFGLKIPPSHFLIEEILDFKNLSPIIDGGFKKIKVKLKPFKIREQTEKIKSLNRELKNIKWRLDLSGGEWRPWEKPLFDLKEDIDFIEDPLFKLDVLKNKRLFAADWLKPPRWASIKIVKPSRESAESFNTELFCRWKRIIFTHSFDHPLGLSATAYRAGVFYKKQPSFFETGAFVNFSLKKIEAYSFGGETAAFAAPKGFGFGFGSSLLKEKWKRWL